jgi:hypothetical protein
MYETETNVAVAEAEKSEIPAVEYKGGTNIVLMDEGAIAVDGYPGVSVVRYCQFGIENSFGFTGQIIDYIGQGQFRRFYFLNGKELGSRKNVGVKAIEEWYPGLMSQVDILRGIYINWLTGYGVPAASALLLNTLDGKRALKDGQTLRLVACSTGRSRFEKDYLVAA